MDTYIQSFDRALRSIVGVFQAARPAPSAVEPCDVLSRREQSLSAGLMRVNSVGEVCAQALYHAQARHSGDPVIAQKLEAAARDEGDHLAWTYARLRELGSRPSLLNPIWYAGAYLMGVLAAKRGDSHSLGFVVETERQVEVHLSGHLEKLPVSDFRSRAIVNQMRLDEIHHGQTAEAMGAEPLGESERAVMRVMARVMTTVAFYM